MAEESDAEKTEEPTEKRLNEARERGQTPQSRELHHAAVLASATLAIGVGSAGIRTLLGHLATMISQVDLLSADPGALGRLLVAMVGDAALAVAAPIAIMAAAGVAATGGQTRFRVSLDPLKPAFSKISPMAGLHRIFSMRGVVELLKNLAKVTVVATIGISVITPAFIGVETMVGLEPSALIERVTALVMRLAGAVAGAITFIALADYIYQRFSFMARLRMSKQEVKDEHKQSEGNPEVKGRIRAIRIQRARKRMMAAVPKATVVITNPTHFAVALKYEAGVDVAPTVVAKGADLVARRIREVATASGVMIVENKPLARALYAEVEIDRTIPPEHYKAVAQVISFVMKARKSAGWRPATPPSPAASGRV